MSQVFPFHFHTSRLFYYQLHEAAILFYIKLKTRSNYFTNILHSFLMLTLMSAFILGEESRGLPVQTKPVFLNKF